MYRGRRNVKACSRGKGVFQKGGCEGKGLFVEVKGHFGKAI